MQWGMIAWGTIAITEPLLMNQQPVSIAQVRSGLSESDQGSESAHHIQLSRHIQKNWVAIAWQWFIWQCP
jgi:hypothetical protein